MNLTMKKIFIILSIALISGVAGAQSLFTTSYSIGFGTGDLGSFISQPSFRGFTMDYRKMVNPNVGVGFTTGWNVFYEERPFDSYTSGDLTISGKQWRYSNHLPLLASVAYFLKPGESLNPFVGLGLGTMYTRRNTDMNLYTLEEEAWHFALQPEIGVYYELNDGGGVTVSGKFNQGFKAGDLNSNQSFFTLNFGFTFSN
jgi:outer membrane protein